MEAVIVQGGKVVGVEQRGGVPNPPFSNVLIIVKHASARRKMARRCQVRRFECVTARQMICTSLQ